MVSIERIAIVFLGLLIAAIGAFVAWNSFLDNGVTPNVAAGLTVAVFAIILGAFGLIAVRVNL